MAGAPCCTPGTEATCLAAERGCEGHAPSNGAGKVGTGRHGKSTVDACTTFEIPSASRRWNSADMPRRAEPCQERLPSRRRQTGDPGAARRAKPAGLPGRSPGRFATSAPYPFVSRLGSELPSKRVEIDPKQSLGTSASRQLNLSSGDRHGWFPACLLPSAEAIEADRAFSTAYDLRPPPCARPTRLQLSTIWLSICLWPWMASSMPLLTERAGPWSINLRLASARSLNWPRPTPCHWLQPPSTSAFSKMQAF